MDNFVLWNIKKLEKDFFDVNKLYLYIYKFFS